MNLYGALLNLLETYQDISNNMKEFARSKKTRKPQRGDLIIFTEKWPYVLGNTGNDDRLLRNTMRNNLIMFVLDCEKNQSRSFFPSSIKKLKITVIADGQVFCFKCNGDSFTYVE